MWHVISDLVEVRDPPPQRALEPRAVACRALGAPRVARAPRARADGRDTARGAVRAEQELGAAMMVTPSF